MKNIGKYKVIRQLGAGGFGAVYLAEDKLGEQVAIKVFKLSDPDLGQLGFSMHQRFRDEARILRKLSTNTHIVEMYHFDEMEDGTPFYVMPFLEKSLEQEVGEDAFTAGRLEEIPQHLHPRPAPLPLALTWLRQILEALEAVHRAGLVHRDIKPANIMFNSDGKVQLVDFGIAKLPDSEHSVSGVGMGTRYYMSPEQRESAKHVGARSDVFSVGVLAYRMLTGTMPIGRYRDPVDYVPDLGPEFNQLILSAMAQDPNQRPADAGDFLQRLREVVPLHAYDTANSGETATLVYETAVATRFGSDTPSGRAEEARPLHREIDKVLEQSGEIPPSEMPRLRAMAHVDGLDEEDLHALIHEAVVQRSNGPQAGKTSKIPWSLKSRSVAAIEYPAGGTSFKWLAAVVVVLAAAGGIYVALPTLVPEADKPVASATVPQSESEPEPVISEPVAKAATPTDLTGGEKPAPARDQIEPAPEPAFSAPDVEEQLPLVEASQEAVGEKPPPQPLAEPVATAAPVAAVESDGRKEKSVPVSLAGQVGRTFRDALSDGGDGPLLVVLPTDLFSMGCVVGRDCVNNETPAHTVTISKPIAMMSHEVKFAEYDRFARATGRTLPDDNGWGRGDRPAINVSWEDADAYARWLSAQTGERYRLPSEAEWEFAARAGSKRSYSWGETIDRARANYGSDSCCGGFASGGDRWINSAPVGSFAANDWRLFDMHGNVSEWVQDCYHARYRGAPADGGAWEANCAEDRNGQVLRVLRGGSWFTPPSLTRSAVRFRATAGKVSAEYGFRLVRELES